MYIIFPAFEMMMGRERERESERACTATTRHHVTSTSACVPLCATADCCSPPRVSRHYRVRKTPRRASARVRVLEGTALRVVVPVRPSSAVLYYRWWRGGWGGWGGWDVPRAKVRVEGGRDRSSKSGERIALEQTGAIPTATRYGPWASSERDRGRSVHGRDSLLSRSTTCFSLWVY